MFRVWWALLWRTIVVVVPAVVSWFFAVCALGYLVNGLSESFAMFALLSAMAFGVVLLVVPLKLTIGKAFADFRLEMTPYDKDEMLKKIAPGFTGLVIEGKIGGWNYPYLMEFSINGEASYQTVDLSRDGDLKVLNMAGDEVARCAGKTRAGKYAVRLESSLEGDPTLVLRNGMDKFYYDIGEESASISYSARKQIAGIVNLELIMGSNYLRAVGEKRDAAVLSPPMLVGLLGYAHHLRRHSRGN